MKAQARSANATISDVARLAQVSIKTVSRVLNHEPGVAAKTRSAVETAVKALRYLPNAAARNLSSVVNNTIGLAVSMPIQRRGRAELQYAMRIQLGALAACSRLDLGVLLLPRERFDLQEADEIVDRLRARRITGVVVADPDDHLLRRLGEARVCHAAINSNHLDRDFPVVVVDDQPAAERLVELLIRHGHRRIGFVQGRGSTRVAAHRLAGYRAAMARAGLAVDPAWIAAGDFSFESGLRAGVALLSQPRRVSAIFAANDNMAMGVVHAAHGMGLRVPKDVSVVGFDDAEGVDLLWPPLTTMRQPLQQMAELAVEQLAALMFPLRRDIPPHETPRIFECELVLRASVAGPPDDLAAQAPA